MFKREEQRCVHVDAQEQVRFLIATVWGEGLVVDLLFVLINRHIEIDKITGVMELNAAQQDKNHATFQVQCEGRTYQLQAQSEIEMKRFVCNLGVQFVKITLWVSVTMISHLQYLCSVAHCVYF